MFRVREQPGWPASFCVNMSVISTDYWSFQRKITVSSASNTVSSCPPADCIVSAPFWSPHINFTILARLIIHIYLTCISCLYQADSRFLFCLFCFHHLLIMFTQRLSVLMQSVHTHTHTHRHLRISTQAQRDASPALRDARCRGKENGFDGKCKGLTDNSEEKLWGGSQEEGRWER